MCTTQQQRSCLLFVSLLLACLATAALSSPARPSAIHQDLAVLQQQSLGFWRQWGLDTQHGGFHGTLSFSGQPVQPDTKGLVQQARHVWAFSTYHLHGHAPSNTTAADGTQLPSAQAMAQAAYSFMLQHMRDADSGLWHWNVSREGAVVQPRKVLYGQWFVLYALSQYYTAFGDASARDLALRTFHAIAARWHSPELLGGFTESSDNSFPPESIGEGLGLNEQGSGQGEVRTFNTLLHGVEALTALHRVTSDSMVLQHLMELLDIVCTRLQRANGLLWEEYVPAAKSQWVPAPHTTINYGHNLEAAWLVLDTLAYLQSVSAVDAMVATTAHSMYHAAAVAVGAAAARDGFDSQHGGVFEAGTADGPVSRVKVWWVNAEAMLALCKLHQHYAAVGDAESSSRYLAMLAETTRFVRQHLVNSEGDACGEQRWQVEADGSWRPSGSTDKDTLGNRWKSSYHSSRAFLFLQQWLAASAESA